MNSDFSLSLLVVCILGLALSSPVEGREPSECDVGTVSLAAPDIASIGKVFDEALKKTRSITHGCGLVDAAIIFNVMMGQRDVEESIAEQISEARDSMKVKKSSCTSFEVSLAIAQALVPPIAKAAITAIANANGQASEGADFQQDVELLEAKLEEALNEAATKPVEEDESPEEELALILATATAEAVSNAPCIDAAKNIQTPHSIAIAAAKEEEEIDPCECSKDGVSNGVDTGESGCVSDNSGDFCYIVGNSDTCEGAESSDRYPGAFWTDC